MSKRICQLSLLLLWMLSGSVMGDEARGLYLNGARGTIMKFDNGMRFSLISQGKEKKRKRPTRVLFSLLEMQSGKGNCIKFVLKLAEISR